MRPEVVPWWRQAAAGLEPARVTLAASRHYAASWFSQQAVEKALKAVYIEQRGTLAPRTHDLDALGRLVSVPASLTGDIMLINPAFDLVRYPDATGSVAPVDAISPVLARQHLDAAERVLAWVSTQLP